MPALGVTDGDDMHDYVLLAEPVQPGPPPAGVVLPVAEHDDGLSFGMLLSVDGLEGRV
jgi:hypothetical protein